MRPIRSTGDSVNHRLCSGPLVMVAGPVPDSGIGKIVTAPAIVIRPIATAPSGFAPAHAVNHRLPSGPAVIPSGTQLPGSSYMVLFPSGAVLIMLPETAEPSVVTPTIQRFPSGP